MQIQSYTYFSLSSTLLSSLTACIDKIAGDIQCRF